MFACKRANVSPDLLCVAKAITGGYLPVAATLTSKEIFSAFSLSDDVGRDRSLLADVFSAAIDLAHMLVERVRQTTVSRRPYKSRRIM